MIGLKLLEIMHRMISIKKKTYDRTLVLSYSGLKLLEIMHRMISIKKKTYDRTLVLSYSV
jgi:hypothetical protein